MLRRKSLCGRHIQVVISDETTQDQSDRVYDVGTVIYEEVSNRKLIITVLFLEFIFYVTVMNGIFKNYLRYGEDTG